MATRYGIVTQAEVYGVPVGTLRTLAKKWGPNRELALALWKTGNHDARMLATMLDEPARVTATQMDRWAADCDNWALVDTACFHYWDSSPHAFGRIEKWSSAKAEFTKRAAFALLASAALHGKGDDENHLRGLELIAREAKDERNFVKKAVSWALRAIGDKKSPRLRSEARALARKLAESTHPIERWIGKDALRAFAKPRGSSPS
ncbi:MAG TPA: DNA alkylation repair protein [Polyangiaceae bacterium]|nr:DNA alkylation repair protein [Polyangiaceae bacterium]